MMEQNNTKVYIIRRIHNEIKENNLVIEFSLVSGNCGVFAIALKHVLNEGTLCLINDGGTNRFCHMVLKTDKDEYLDGEGISNAERLKDRWRHEVIQTFEDEPKILHGCATDIKVEDMEKILRLLINGTVKEAKKIYKENCNWYYY